MNADTDLQLLIVSVTNLKAFGGGHDLHRHIGDLWRVVDNRLRYSAGDHVRVADCFHLDGIIIQNVIALVRSFLQLVHFKITQRSTDSIFVRAMSIFDLFIKFCTT